MAPANKGKSYTATEGILKPEEVGRLLSQCSRRYPTGVRNRALIAILYRAGLRVSEALALRPSDIDEETGAIQIINGKGGKNRIAAIDQGGLDAIAAWRTHKKRPKSRWLLCTLKGDRMDSSYVRHLFKRLGEKAEIGRRIHAHGLRHTHAFELVSEGVPLLHIKDQLGHSNIAVTNTYINHLNPSERVGRINQREWQA